MEKIINIYNISDWQDASGYPAGTRQKVLYDENKKCTDFCV